MSVDRREFLTGAGAAFVLGDYLPPQEPSRAADLKLAGAKEFTTACNFCSCGCGMVGHVVGDKLVNLEGDPGHVVNDGALCVKGTAMLATHDSPRRVRAPMLRKPGSDSWTEISWDEALDTIARKIQDVRTRHWVASEKVGEADVPVHRTDALAFLGGAQNTNEECYLWVKMARLFGVTYIEHQARL